MPLTTNVGKNIKELRGSAKHRPAKQILAIALEGAREAGADIPESPRKKLAKVVAKYKK